ncbi:MAG: DUF3536 domain-containing protein [Nitrososphaerota archaeon]
MPERSAYPYHDWNERITAECYAPNTPSEVWDEEGHLTHIINNYSWMSFDFGPTLLDWMEKKARSVYRAILKADEISKKRFSGHGSALAHPYSHVILPLTDHKDKRTLIRWGIADFKRRFGRYPEGMWLPETAVCYDTLEALAEEGIKFTILSPHQAEKVRKIGEAWTDVSDGRIDPKLAYLCPLRSGREITIFFYDKYISNDVAFGDLLKDGKAFAQRLLAAFKDEPIAQLESIATDGETYGHHKRQGHLALSSCLHHILVKKLARITNYGEFLERFPPKYEVKIIENTSWSCVHGIERWRNGCSCSTGLHPGWSQAWRRALREAHDWLRDRLLDCFELHASQLLKDPWKARDDYISVIHQRSKEAVESFLAQHAKGPLSYEAKSKILKLLEMQRHSFLMQTSCAWFFDDISNIESIYSMMQAARAIQLCKEATDTMLEDRYVKILQNAKSNIEEEGDGSQVFLKRAKPHSLDIIKVGAHFVVCNLFGHHPLARSVYIVFEEESEDLSSGSTRMRIGKLRMGSKVTWDEATIMYAVLLDGLNVLAGVKPYDESFTSMMNEIKSKFKESGRQELILLIKTYFGSNLYSLKDLPEAERRRIVAKALEPTIREVKIRYEDVLKENEEALYLLRKISVPIPRSLRIIAEYIISSKIRAILNAPTPDLDRLEMLVKKAKDLSLAIDKKGFSVKAVSPLRKELSRLMKDPTDVNMMERVRRILASLRTLDLTQHFWLARKATFIIFKKYYEEMRARSDAQAIKWLSTFDSIKAELGMKLKT